MRTVFSRYRPIKPAVGAAVVGGVVLFAYARRSAGDVDGYVRLYQLGLALPSRLVAPDSGLRLSDFAVVSGSAWLAWLGVMVMIGGVVYATVGFMHKDLVMNKEMEDIEARARDYERHQAEIAGLSAPQGHAPPQPTDPFNPQQNQPHPMGYPPATGYPGNYPPPQALG